jgi:hypothetical protein
VTANELMEMYASMYFGDGAVTSVYLWDLGEGSIAGCFLVRKRELRPW